MEKNKKNDLWHIISILYFLLALFMLTLKFGIILKNRNIAYRIFEIYYYTLIPTIIISLFLIIVFIVKSKREKNEESGNRISKSIISLINIFIISFEVFASLFRTFSIELIASNWFRLTIYVSIIFIVIDVVVYLFVRGKIINEYSLYMQNSIINKYIIYAVIVALLLSIIIPNFMIHYGIMSVIKNF